MDNPDELALVVKALQSGLGGCVEWHPHEHDRIRREMKKHRLTPEGIRRETIQFVQNGGQVQQVKEERETWKDERDYYYKVIIPMPGVFKKGLFVEMQLSNSDSEYPEVLLLNAHEQQ